MLHPYGTALLLTPVNCGAVLCCRHRATRLCIEAAQNLMKACGGDLQFEGPGWNSCTVDMIRVTKAHAQLILHQTFVDAVDKLQRAVSRECATKLIGW